MRSLGKVFWGTVTILVIGIGISLGALSITAANKQSKEKDGIKVQWTVKEEELFKGESISYDIMQYQLEDLNGCENQVLRDKNTKIFKPILGDIIQIKTSTENINGEEKKTFITSAYLAKGIETQYLNLTLKRGIKYAGRVLDRNKSYFPYSFLIFKNEQYCFMTQTDAQGMYEIELLPNETYDMIITQPGEHDDVQITIGKVTTEEMAQVGDKAYNLTTNEAVFSPYILNAALTTDYVTTNGEVGITLEMRGVGDYDYSETDALYQIRYEWSATGGEIEGTGNTIVWKAPEQEGIYEISVVICSKHSSQTLKKDFKVEVSNDLLNGQDF